VFKQLNGTFDEVKYQALEEQISYGSMIDNEFRGIQYRNVGNIVGLDFASVIPEEYRKHFVLSVMRINTHVPPHTDSCIKVSINAYIKTEACRTVFYDVNPDAKPYQINNQTNGVLYEYRDLKPVDSFISNPGETWVLDVTKPHSVEPLTKFDERIAIAYGTADFTYDEVCKMLKQTESL